MTSRSRSSIAVTTLVLTAVAAGVWLWLTEEETSGALTLYGNVEVREVVLGFRVPGRITEMTFQEGETVSPGDLLARLDAEPYLEALATARAGVEQAEARLAKLESGFRPQEIEQAAAEVDRAEAAWRNAEKNYRRKLGLLDSGASSQRQVDAALAELEQTRAALAAAREAVGLLREGFRTQDVAAARAELAAARARVDEAETRLADTELTAPGGGVVLTRVHEPGAVVGAGSPVYAVSLGNPAHIRAYVSEPHLGRVVPGAKVRVTTDSAEGPSEGHFEGHVGFVSPRAEFTPRTVQTPELRTDLVYRIRVVVPDPGDALRQGMPVTVHVPLDGATPEEGRGDGETEDGDAEEGADAGGEG